MTKCMTELNVRAVSRTTLHHCPRTIYQVHTATHAMPPNPTLSTTHSSFLFSEEPSRPPSLILSESPYSRIALPAIDRIPSARRDTLAHSQWHSSSFCTDPLAPQTPPPITHAKSPYHCIPLPPQIDSNTAISINPVLDFTLRPPINFDFSLPPSSITTPHCHEHCLFEPATNPILPSLTVISSLLPWPITIHTSSINPAFVTVADVLGTIHGAVQLRVTEAEFEYLESYPAVRARSGYGARGVYRREMKRLDFFGGKNRFLGLSKSSMGWDTWVLNVE